MKKNRVSIIEDNSVVRNSVVQFLSKKEHIEIGAVHESAILFLDSIIANPKDQNHILLLDIGLRRMSGIEAIPLILDKYPNISIIILTTYEEEDVILKALCSGACAYISKRSSLDDIAQAIDIVAEGGAYMSPSIAREIINHLMGGRISKASILTDRQREILKGLVAGKSYQSIAAELHISVETVRTHVKKMYKTLHVNNKTEAITQYMRGYIK